MTTRISAVSNAASTGRSAKGLRSRGDGERLIRICAPGDPDSPASAGNGRNDRHVFTRAQPVVEVRMLGHARHVLRRKRQQRRSHGDALMSDSCSTARIKWPPALIQARIALTWLARRSRRFQNSDTARRALRAPADYRERSTAEAAPKPAETPAASARWAAALPLRPGSASTTQSADLRPISLRPQRGLFLRAPCRAHPASAHPKRCRRLGAKTGITNRLRVPVGNSTTNRRVGPCCNPPVTSIVPVKDGPSLLTSKTIGNQLASGTMPS